MNDPAGLPPQRDLIDGIWVDAESVRVDARGGTRWIEHASNGEPVQEQRASTSDAIERALVASWRVHDTGAWSWFDAEERAAYLDAMADHLESAVPRVAELESVESGATIGVTSMLGFILHGAFRLAAAQLRAGVLVRSVRRCGGRHRGRAPRVGPGAVALPLERAGPDGRPQGGIRAGGGVPGHHQAARACAARDGCDRRRCSGRRSARRAWCRSSTEVPRSRPCCWRTPVSAASASPAGSRAVARSRMRAPRASSPRSSSWAGTARSWCSTTPSPAQAAAAVVALLTTLNGQWCRALGRLLLPASRREEYLAAVSAALAEVVIGDPLDPATQMGPIVHSEHLAMLQVADRRDGVRRRSRHRAGGRCPTVPGNWMSPTLIDGLDPAHTRDEIFGPVAMIHCFDDDDEAVELANGTEYGLEAYVLGSDTVRAMAVARRVRAGEVKVNGASPMNLHLMAPRPAFGLSGLAEEGTVETIEFFSGNRVVGIEGPG